LKHNAELNKTLGNLVHRATSLTIKGYEGKVPKYIAGSFKDVKEIQPFDIAALKKECIEAIDTGRMGDAGEAVIKA